MKSGRRRSPWRPRRSGARSVARATSPLKRDGHERLIRDRTGLDAYFSGSKVAWNLDNVPGVRVRAEAGELAFGTVRRHSSARCASPPGLTKNTCGTGCFLLQNTGERPMASKNQLVTTVAWQVGGKTMYALEGSGAAAANDALLQCQADLLGVAVVRPEVTETTALGAAYLAGLAVGFWDSIDALARHWRVQRRFEPSCTRESAAARRGEWRSALERSKGWVKPEPRR